MRNYDAVDKPNNAFGSQTLYSAYKSGERERVFNNAACVSMSGCRRGQCGRKCVAQRKVIKHFNVSLNTS